MTDNESYYKSDFLEDAYRPPLWMTLVFCITMLAIYFMGRSVSGTYESPTPPMNVQTL